MFRKNYKGMVGEDRGAIGQADGGGTEGKEEREEEMVGMAVATMVWFRAAIRRVNLDG